MLELLLQTYKDQFGEDFPLKDFAGHQEIEVINIVYECVLTNKPYTKGMTVTVDRFPDAPRS